MTSLLWLLWQNSEVLREQERDLAADQLVVARVPAQCRYEVEERLAQYYARVYPETSFLDILGYGCLGCMLVGFGIMMFVVGIVGIVVWSS